MEAMVGRFIVSDRIKELEVLDRVSFILYDILGLSNIHGGTSLDFADDIDWNEIIHELQIEFNIDIPTDMQWNKVYEIIDYICKKI